MPAEVATIADLLQAFNMPYDLLMILNTFDDLDRGVTYAQVGNPGPLGEEHFRLSLAELHERGFSRLKVARNALFGMDMSQALVKLPISRVMPCAGHAAIRIVSKVRFASCFQDSHGLAGWCSCGPDCSASWQLQDAFTPCSGSLWLNSARWRALSHHLL